MDMLQAAYGVCVAVHLVLWLYGRFKDLNEKYRKFPRHHLSEQSRLVFPRVPSQAGDKDPAS